MLVTFFLSLSALCNCNAYVNSLKVINYACKISAYMVFIIIIISVIVCSYIHACIALDSYLLLCIHISCIVFLVDPVSVAAVDGTTVEFTCTANGATNLGYFVNDTSATFGTLSSKGFTEQDIELLDNINMVLRRNLTAIASSLYNNTRILCTASPMDIDSEVANLTVQGNLQKRNMLACSN